MQKNITQAIVDWAEGNSQSQENLYVLIYDHLRKLASKQRLKVADKFGQSSIEEHINSTTAIVHEVYIKLENSNGEYFRHRKEFFIMVARTIHNILVDQARKNAAQKRQAELTTLDDVGEESAFEFLEQDQKMLDLGNALQQMEAEYPRQAQSMQLKYFGGLLVKEISDISDAEYLDEAATILLLDNYNRNQIVEGKF